MFGLPPFRLCPARGRAATELGKILCPVVSNSRPGQLSSGLRCSQFSNSRLGGEQKEVVGREDLNLRLRSEPDAYPFRTALSLPADCQASRQFQ